MSETKDITGGDCPTPPCSASDILSQWREMNQERSKILQDRTNNVFMPPMGIEEVTRMNQSDIEALMWFTDKALKMLAEIESKGSLPNTHDPQ